MDDKMIQAIQNALKNGFRVELLMDKNGKIIAQTIQRNRI